MKESTNFTMLIKKTILYICLTDNAILSCSIISKLSEYFIITFLMSPE